MMNLSAVEIAFLVAALLMATACSPIPNSSGGMKSSFRSEIPVTGTILYETP